MIARIRALAEQYVKDEQYPVFRRQVQDLLEQDNREELYERFYKPLEFGTGGLRGKIGGGLNRLNCYTIRKATHGLARYICDNVPEERRHVCLAYDSRNYSDLFAREAALTLAASGIRSSIFRSLRPTPELSFAVRQLKACAGIVITASHNPAQYNGYKVYWDDGAQIVAPHDKGIMAKVNAVTGPLPSIAEEAAGGLLCWVDEEIDAPYIDMVVKQSLRPELEHSLEVVYTPLHGAGRRSVEQTLEKMGGQVFTVPEQAEPDGNFPTVPFPNPEIAPALELALRYARERKADLVLGTDPDADRLGIAVPDSSGEYVLISGNQLGAMLCDYIFRTRKEQGSLPPNAAFVNTIVTSNLQNRIAQSYGVADFKVLTGFKFIGALIREWQENKKYEYIFGCEESYGFLIGTAVRDKDAVSASAMTVEMTLWNLQQGRSLLDYLNNIYRRYGYYQEILLGHNFEGSQGTDTMKRMMDDLRQNSPGAIGSIEIEAVKDYAAGTTTLASGAVKPDIELPKSNVLQFYGTDGSIVTARPSGTEPKIKFYASCVSKTENLERARCETATKISGVEEFVRQQIAMASK